MSWCRNGDASRAAALLCLSLLSGYTACRSDADEAADAPTSRAAGPILDPDPVLDIGGTGPDREPIVLDPRSVMRSGDRIVVSDYDAPAVRFFDLRGRHIRSVGREGAGPGEFRRLSSVRACGADSVFAHDSRLHRMTAIDTAGTMVRQFRTPTQALNIACSRAGVVVVQLRSQGAMNAPGTYDVEYSSILLMDTQGDTTAVLDSIRLVDERPLGTLTTVAAADDRVYVGTAESSYVDVYSLEGRHQGRVRTGVARRPATKAMQEAFVDNMLEGMYRDDPQQLAKFREHFLSAPMPSHAPAYRRVLAAPNAMLWVDLTLPGDTTKWLRAIAPDGTILGDARLPPAMEPLSVDDEYLFVRYEDSGGEPHVAMYRVREPARSARRTPGRN